MEARGLTLFLCFVLTFLGLGCMHTLVVDLNYQPSGRFLTPSYSAFEDQLSNLMHRNTNITSWNDFLNTNSFDPSIKSSSICGENRNPTEKVVFLHVFKTAGSSFRSLLWDYADRCGGLGYMIVKGCSYMEDKLSETSTWNSEGNLPERNCQRKRFLSREGIVDDQPQAVSQPFVDEEVDLLIGHLPYGIHSFFPQQHDIQYLTFARSPPEKYVSGFLYLHRKISFDEVVAEIKQRLKNAAEANSYAEGYSNYFLTPEQKRQLSMEGNGSVEERVKLVLRNLIEMPAAVGIVERMGSSMDLISYVLDSGDRLRDLWDQMVPSAETSFDKTSEADVLVRNRSRLSTGSVLEALRSDEKVARQMDEYLKYDRMVYNLANAIHDQQHQWLAQRER